MKSCRGRMSRRKSRHAPKECSYICFLGFFCGAEKPCRKGVLGAKAPDLALFGDVFGKKSDPQRVFTFLFWSFWSKWGKMAILCILCVLLHKVCIKWPFLIILGDQNEALNDHFMASLWSLVIFLGTILGQKWAFSRVERVYFWKIFQRKFFKNFPFWKNLAKIGNLVGPRPWPGRQRQPWSRAGFGIFRAAVCSFRKFPKTEIFERDFENFPRGKFRNIFEKFRIFEI